MNDPELLLKRMEDLLKAADKPSLSTAEQAGIYAAARFIVADFEGWWKGQNGLAYASEKIHDYLWHLGAMVGFDITNGHPNSQHYSWALGSLGTFRGLVKERLGKE